MIKQLWFDTSGTLYKLTPEFKAFHGKHLYATYAQVVGEPDPDKAKQDYDKLLDTYSSNSAVFSALGMPPGFWQNEFDTLDLSGVLRPDPVITETLAALKERMPISIFTNLHLAKLHTLLGHLGIPFNNFTHVLTGEDFAEPKPGLEGFRKMIAISEMPAAELLYIGDSVDKDIKPAKQLSMKTCLVWSSSAEADYSAPEFKDLLDIIDTTNPENK